MAQAPKPAAAPKKILMWKAQSGPNTVYLLGSIHIGSKAMYPLAKPIDDAYKASKVLVVEVNINNVDLGQAADLMAKGKYPDGDDLWKHLSKPTAEKVKKFFTKYGFPEAVAGGFKPWLAAIMASVLPMMKAGMEADLGIDKHFLDLAAKDKKEVVEAETADFQFKLLSSVPDSIADIYLSWSIGEADKPKSDDLKLEKLWRSGDAEALGAEEEQYPKELTGFMNSLIRDRNPHMADLAEKYLKGGGPCFFVVGAGHLVGKDGVVALLQKRGYKVEQVSAQ